MKYATLAVAALVVLGAAAMPATAETTKDYLIATTPGVGLVWASPAGNVGGVFFFAGEDFTTRPTGVVISDASGGDVQYTVCQDFDGNSLCGDTAAGEPRVDGCGTNVDLADSEVAFTASFDVAVFVTMWSPDCPATVATTGQITLAA